MKTHRLATILGAGALALCAGCAGPVNRRVDANEEAMIDARGVQDDDYIIAARDLSKKISERTAQGWPSHVLLTEDGRPVVRVHKIVNHSRLRGINTLDITNNVYNELVNQGAVYVVAGANSNDMEAVESEREYSGEDMGMTDSEIPGGQEDRTSMVINGEITQEKIEQGDVEQYTTFFTLRLVDTVKKRIVLITRTKVRKEYER